MIPLSFEPIYQDYLWGGARIKDHYARVLAPTRCAESWEIADRPEGSSRVKAGLYSGETLSQLMKRGEKFMGQRHAYREVFPLLLKLIDACEVLSVQVHPSEKTAAICQGEPKTEAWVILEGGEIYAGLRRGVTAQQVEEAIGRDSIVPLLQKRRVSPGDLVLIPGGCIHAIGAGCLVLEVQQNSNTTYRIYDWERVGSDGKKRALHVREALQCIDCAAQPQLQRPRLLEKRTEFKRSALLTSSFFSIEQWEMQEDWQQRADPTQFQIFFCRERGETVLLPACSEPFTLNRRSSYLKVFI